MRGLALSTLFLGLSLIDIDLGRPGGWRRKNLLVLVRLVVFFATLIAIWLGA
jgi:hypothetical protein